MIIETETKIRLITEASEAMKAADLLILDLRGVSTFTDFFVLATVASRTQLRAILREIRRRLKEAGDIPVRCDGEDSDHWAVMDLGDIVIHVFDAETRVRYSLERLWGDARLVDTADFLTA
ncbi:ribosome silencing factor [Candidatus Sumerlaeota bacterium]|nr:ribosome silencing factor [Candidatus Sumerlaeota bacterium]